MALGSRTTRSENHWSRVSGRSAGTAIAIRKSGASFISTHMESIETRQPWHLAQIKPQLLPRQSKKTKFLSNVIIVACISTKVLFPFCFFTNFPTNSSYFHFSGATSVPSAPAMCPESSTHCEFLQGEGGRLQTALEPHSVRPKTSYPKIKPSLPGIPEHSSGLTQPRFC